MAAKFNDVATVAWRKCCMFFFRYYSLDVLVSLED